MNEILSPVESAAEHDNLGALLASYHGRFRVSVIILVVVTALILAAIGPSMAGASADVSILLAALGVLVVVGAFVMWRWERRHSHDDLYHFANGLIHRDRHATVTSYPWAAITDVRSRRLELSVQNIPLPSVNYLKATREDGVSVVLNNRFRGVSRLIGEVQEEVAAARLPIAVATLRAGQTISFDGMVVDAQGIRHRRTTIAWPTIVAIGAAEGFLSTRVIIRVRDRRRSHVRRLFPSRPFPNQLLLVGLARTLGAQ